MEKNCCRSLEVLANAILLGGWWFQLLWKILVSWKPITWKYDVNIIQIWFEYHLVGGWALPLWKRWVNLGWDYEIPNIWKNEKWSKPPTRIVISKTNSWKAWKDNLLANSKWIWELIYQISKWRSGRHGNIANLGAIPLLNSISFPMPPSTVYHQAPIKPHFKETNRWNLVMSIPD